MPASIHVIPAYGRDYKSEKGVQAAWDSNSDFLMQPAGAYINKSDWERFGDGAKVWVHCAKLGSITEVTGE